MRLFHKVRNLKYIFDRVLIHAINHENQLLINGKLLTEFIAKKKNINSLSQVEFKVFSQFEDDGIIQWLINNIEFPNNTFIEFGVEDYRESNTRFLMMNNNWTGYILDSNSKNISKIINSEYYWKYELVAKTAFIDEDNVNELLSSINFDPEVGILNIDIDGNDYWIWKKINCIKPIVVIIEYNSIFGIDRPITIPYDAKFNRTNSHYSNLYFGASLLALYQLSLEKGYSFIGCNSAGNNAFFVRNDKLNTIVTKKSLIDGYTLSKFRESRNRDGKLTHLIGNERQNLIKGMPVINTETNQKELI